VSNVTEDVASVVALWRYPVKSMMGEELNAAEVTERGVLGDRPYALVDAETGKVVSAKEPRKWAKLFEFRASFVEPPVSGKRLPHVRFTFPDGRSMTTWTCTRRSSRTERSGEATRSGCSSTPKGVLITV